MLFVNEQFLSRNRDPLSAFHIYPCVLMLLKSLMVISSFLDMLSEVFSPIERYLRPMTICNRRRPYDAAVGFIVIDDNYKYNERLIDKSIFGIGREPLRRLQGSTSNLSDEGTS